MLDFGNANVGDLYVSQRSRENNVLYIRVIKSGNSYDASTTTVGHRMRIYDYGVPA